MGGRLARCKGLKVGIVAALTAVSVTEAPAQTEVPLRKVKVEDPQEAEELWPTAFTPFKADGRNDEFLSPKTPGKQERANWTLLVFDREGRTVYEGKCGWDGKRNGTPVLPGQYYYIVHFPNGGSHKDSVLVVKE